MKWKSRHGLRGNRVPSSGDAKKEALPFAFVRKRHIKACPLRFDVVAIDDVTGQLAVVRPQSGAQPTSLTPRVRKSPKIPLRCNMRFTRHATAE